MKKLTLLLALTINLVVLNGQTNHWAKLDENSADPNLFANRTKPKSFKLFKLNDQAFKNLLRTSPSEKNTAPKNSSVIVYIPDVDGTTKRYKIVESPVMDAGLIAKYPGIFSYTGVCIEDPSLSARFAISDQGMQGILLSSKRSMVYLDLLDKKSNTYMAVSRDNLDPGEYKFKCLTEDVHPAGITTDKLTQRNADDGKLRTYRLALCTTGEFSAHWLDGSETSDAQRKGKVLAALNNVMTMTNAIYEKELGIRMVLIANNDAVIYLNASTDPFTTSGSWNSQTQNTCTNVIGSANYDIGHMVTKAGNNGNAGCIGCICSANKGSGWTAYSDPSNNYFVIDYLTHEMGHQFGGNHTFAFSDENTIAQVEPGSGSTIMGYAGITGSTDVQAHSDPYFHAVTIQQITAYIQTGNGNSCDVETLTGNNIPTANAGANYTIPRSTPFELTGSGTDADGSDILSYAWEQMNVIGTAQSFPSATATAGPLFRSISPSNIPTRTFPTLNSILSGTNGNTWEVLSSAARTLNFRLMVRDNRIGGGGNQSDDMTVTVSSTTGPFAVSAPNTNVSWAANSSQLVTWSVNGTNGAPINCANVDILISNDGGNSFSILLSNTPNDGSQSVVIPNTPGSTNRIKIQAVGNIFFDISNTNFTISAPALCGDASGLSTTSISQSGATLNWNSVASAISYDVQYKITSASIWTNAAIGTAALNTTLSGLSANTIYDWRVRANCSAGAGNYVVAQFTTLAAPGLCPSSLDTEPNGTIAQAAVITLNTDVQGRLASSGDNDYFRLNIVNGGSITVSLTTLPANYQLQFLSATGTVLASSSNGGTNNESITRTVTSGTTYYLRVYPRNGSAWNATSCYTLRAGDGTASLIALNIASKSSQNLVELFPNPASDWINLNTNRLNDKANIRIFNMMGKMVFQSNTNQTQNQLNISDLPSGSYALNYSDGKESYTLKFIKK